MLKFGVQVNCYRTTWDEIRASIETLESGRWHSLWFADHFMPPRGSREEERLTAFEGWTLIAVAAGMTERLELGHLVLGNTYRNPALVAKMAATLDQISGGRLEFGVGAGGTNRAERQKSLGYEYEFDAYGTSFPMSPSIRIEKLDEGLEIMKTF